MTADHRAWIVRRTGDEPSKGLAELVADLITARYWWSGVDGRRWEFTRPIDGGDDYDVIRIYTQRYPGGSVGFNAASSWTLTLTGRARTLDAVREWAL